MLANLLVLSHVLAFSVLFIDSLFDILNNNDVPDFFGIFGIIGGIGLHAAYSYTIGSLEPLIWCLGVGMVFSVYGWLAYWKGMWGGADAVLLSALGFMVPGPATGNFSVAYVLDLITNFMIAAVFVTVLYSAYKFFEQDGNPRIFVEKFMEDERTIAGIIAAAGVLSALLITQGSNGYLFFLLITVFVLLYEVLKVIEQNFMVEEKNPGEVEVGEVAAPDQGYGEKIRGLTEEEVDNLDEEIEVRTGVPFIPVFLLAVLLTDLTVSGVWLIYSIY